MHGYGKSGYHRIITGAVFIGVSFFLEGFGGMRHAPGGGFFRLVFLWVGVFSLIRGASDILSDYFAVRKKKSDPDTVNIKKIERDGIILRLARKNRGFVSVSEASLELGESLESTEAILNSFVSKGYASMEVTDTGKIRYYFQEFDL